MDGLSDLEITSVTVVGGTPSYALLGVQCTIRNPSNVSMLEIGDCYFSLYYSPPKHRSRVHSAPLTNGLRMENASLATIYMENLTLKPGANVVDSICYFTVPPKETNPQDHAAALTILSNFIRGIPTPDIIISGHPTKSSQVPYLRPALTSLRVVTTLPGLPPSEKMIKTTKMVLNPIKAAASLLSLSSPTKLEMYNPFDVQVTVLKMISGVTYQGTKLGTVNVDFMDPTSKLLPIKIPPKQTVTSPTLKLALNVGVGALTAIFEAAGGRLEVDIDAILDVKTGEYVIEGLAYKQEKVPVSLSFN